ncbi:MAG: RNA-binding protein [Candidatus Aenigmarchaeota archaeon]|nr:RNA-binding protein [Candidatus Aenigmarchaeota archaeon]
MRCSTCNVNTLVKTNFIRFNCPDCGQAEIVRCANCKNLSSKYSCSKCKFLGP